MTAVRVALSPQWPIGFNSSHRPSNLLVPGYIMVDHLHFCRLNLLYMDFYSFEHPPST